MAAEYFKQAETLLEQIGASPVLMRDSDTIDLLSGADFLCRTPLVIVRDELTEEQWEQFPLEDRNQLIRTYTHLGESAEPLYTTTQFVKPDYGFHRLRGDIKRMAQQSASAQFIATCLVSRFDEFCERIHTPDVTNLATASLQTVIAWRREQEYLGAEPNRSRYYRSNLESGLTKLQNVFWHYR